MSKKSDAKRKQGYNDMPIPRTCGNCEKYQSELVVHKYDFGEYTQEKNMRCGLGGFAVKNTATCNEWSQS